MYNKYNNIKKNKTIRLLAVVLLVYCSYSCTAKKHIAIREIKIQLKDSVINGFPYDKENYTAIYPIKYQGKEWILQGNTRSGYTSLVGIDKENKNKNIKLDSLQSIKKAEKIKCFNYVNADSIWAISPAQQKIFLYNIEGKLLRKFQINSEFEHQNTELYATMRGWPFAVDNEKGNVIVPIFSLHPENGNYFKTPKFASLKLKNDDAVITAKFGTYPNYYSNQFLGNGLNANICYFANNLLVNYYLSDSLYVYSNDGSLIKAIPASSIHAEKPTSFFDTTQDRNRDYANEFSFSYNAYLSLETNSSSPYLLRTAEHAYPYYNKDSTINQPIEKPWGIIILDSSLHQIGEANIGYNQLSKIEYMPYKKGFWAKSLTTNNYYYYEFQF